MPGQSPNTLRSKTSHTDQTKNKKAQIFPQNVRKKNNADFFGNSKRAYRNWQDDFWVSSEVSDVAVQRHALLCRPGLAHGQRDPQDGVGTELCCEI